MLHLAILFFVIALIAGALGFTNVAGTAMEFAKVLFYLFLILFLVFVVLGRGAF